MEELGIGSAAYLASKISALGTSDQYGIMAEYVIDNNLDVEALEACEHKSYESKSGNIADQIMESLEPQSKTKKKDQKEKDRLLHGRMDALIKKILIQTRRSRAGPVEVSGLDIENCKFNGVYDLTDENYNDMPMYVHVDKSNLILSSYYEKYGDDLKIYTLWRLSDSRNTGPDSKAGIYFNVKRLQLPEKTVLYQPIAARDADGKNKNAIVQMNAEINRFIVPSALPDVAVKIKRESDFHDSDNSESTSKRVKRESTSTK